MVPTNVSSLRASLSNSVSSRLMSAGFNTGFSTAFVTAFSHASVGFLATSRSSSATRARSAFGSFAFASSIVAAIAVRTTSRSIGASVFDFTSTPSGVFDASNVTFLLKTVRTAPDSSHTMSVPFDSRGSSATMSSDTPFEFAQPSMRLMSSGALSCPVTMRSDRFSAPLFTSAARCEMIVPPIP